MYMCLTCVRGDRSRYCSDQEMVSDAIRVRRDCAILRCNVILHVVLMCASRVCALVAAVVIAEFEGETVASGSTVMLHRLCGYCAAC